MSNEHVEQNYPAWDLSDDQRERLLWRNNEVRKAAKDLNLNIEALPENFPSRQRLLELVREIMTLVPPLDSDDEARDEQERRQLAESLNRVRK